MTLQSDLQDAVARVQSDSQTLHDIIHGDDETVVDTEGGPVKSPAFTRIMVEPPGTAPGSAVPIARRNLSS